MDRVFSCIVTFDARRDRWSRLCGRRREMSCSRRHSEAGKLFEGRCTVKVGVRQQSHGLALEERRRCVRGLEHRLVLDPRRLDLVRM